MDATNSMTNTTSIRRGFVGDPFFLALKTALSTFVALSAAAALAVPDLVTATFVALLCCSPTVSGGLRRGIAQFLGSALGGAFGTAALILHLPLHVGVAVAVGGAVHAAFWLGFPSGYTVAAFTALFVQLVPFGSPETTFVVRLSAVLLGASSGMIVNFVVSAAVYDRVFVKRLRRAEGLVNELLASAARQGPGVLGSAFAPIAAMGDELRQARAELTWRHAHAMRQRLDEVAERLETLGRVVHLAYDLGVTIDEQGLAAEAASSFLGWLAAPVGDPPDVHLALAPTTARLVALQARLRRGALAESKPPPKRGDIDE